MPVMYFMSSPGLPHTSYLRHLFLLQTTIYRQTPLSVTTSLTPIKAIFCLRLLWRSKRHQKKHPLAAGYTAPPILQVKELTRAIHAPPATNNKLIIITCFILLPHRNHNEIFIQSCNRLKITSGIFLITSIMICQNHGA